MAADLAQVESAFLKADAAGDTQAATVLAAEVRRLRASREPAADPSEGGLPLRPFGVDTGLTMPQGVSRFAAGAGKAITDIGRGTAQLFGADNQKTIDESRRLDAPLMDTGAGLAGNITGNVAATLPAMAIPGVNGVVGGAALGGALGAAQPVATGESRGQNVAMGAAGGAAIPVLGAALRSGKSVVEPLYNRGREQIMGRLINRVSGENAPAVQQRLASALELVPGSRPTAAEVAQSGGVAALQRAASAADPESYAVRAAQQNEARVAALTELAGTGGEREFHAAARTTAADELYKKAYEKGVDIRRNPVTGQFLPKAEIAGVQGEITKLMQRPAVADAMREARELAANEGVNLSNPAGSIKGLDYLKRALDDKIKKAELGSNEARIFTDLKNRVLTTIDRLSPDYAQARTTFAQMSRPINQMDISQEIADKSINKLTGVLQPQSFARALSDDTAAAATGFNKATLENTLEPKQLALLQALRGDLSRSVSARDLGRGPGSDTMQKLSMSNIGEQSGMPKLVDLVSSLPGVSRATSWVYRDVDQKIREQLSQALLDPKKAATLMREAHGNPKLAAALRGVQRAAIPVGAALPASYSQQQ